MRVNLELIREQIVISQLTDDGTVTLPIDQVAKLLDIANTIVDMVEDSSSTIPSSVRERLISALYRTPYQTR